MNYSREDILLRLKAVLETVPDITEVLRNPVTLEDLQLPCIVLYDGDEAAMEGDYSTGRPNATPVRVTMTPEILVKVQTSPDNAGTVLNTYLDAIKKAILTDVELENMASRSRSSPSGGGIAFLGAQTTFGVGREVTGDLACSFAITYVLRPNSL